MRQILMLVGQSLMQQFLRSPDPGHHAAIGPALFEPAKEFAAETAREAIRKYALVATLSFFFSLYFVAGTLIMITAAASSFDAFGFFAPGSFFYSGVAVTVISLGVLGGCYASVRKGKKKKTKAEVVEAQVPAISAPAFQFGHVAEAIVSGIISGIVSRRFSKPAPAPTTLRERLRQVI
ncbi:MAG: hypothetical protein AB7K68_04135 [Bacteriovoracia bacterium]